jgi:hypothetical protein
MNAEKTLYRYFSPLLGKKNGKARTAQDDPASEQKIDTAEKMLAVLRGTSSLDGFNTLWSTNALWGSSASNATQSLSVDVDGEN